MHYETDAAGRLIIPDAETLTRLDIWGRADVKLLPPLPAATAVNASGCTGLTSLYLPAATVVNVIGCTGLTSLYLPAATVVDAIGCAGLTSLELPAAKFVNASGCTGLRHLACPALPTPPVIPDLAARVAAAVGDGESLDMSNWHCGTSHCHAGWITTIAGEAGAALEAASNTATAAALIVMASQPHLGVPDFYVGNDEALADIRRRAA